MRVPKGFQAIVRNEWKPGPLDVGSWYVWVFKEPKYSGNLSFETLNLARGGGAICREVYFAVGLLLL